MIARLLLLGAVSLVTMGAQSSCSASYGDRMGDINNPPGDGNGSGDGPTFTTTLVLKDSSGAIRGQFQRGDLMTFELIVRNRTDQSVRIQFADGAQQDFTVFDDGTHVLRWRWMTGKVFTQATTDLVFAAHETRTFSATWDQVMDQGALLDAGRFEARGVVLFSGYSNDLQAPNELGSTLVPFTITR
jgi:hypothetical protein